MPNYFACRFGFRPHKKESWLPDLDSIPGNLENFSVRPGNSPSGIWFVIRLRKDEDSFNAYFDADYIGADEIKRLESLRGRKIILGCKDGQPDIIVSSVRDEGEVRAELLKGVAAGTIKMEDLPALLAFAKGDEGKYDKWELFKIQIKNEGLEKVREETVQRNKKYQNDIEREKHKYYNLNCIYQEVLQQMDEMLRNINSSLIFLQGEDSLHGTTFMSYGSHSDNLIAVNDSYSRLLEGFEKFRTRKGVFVICGNTLHKIHHVYLEEKGRAYLLGSSQEFLRSKPEKIKELIDKIDDIRHNKQLMQD